MVIRDEAVLTTSYVAGNIIGRIKDNDSAQQQSLERKNQLVLYIDFTIGSLTSAEVKIEFAPVLYYDLAYDGQTANFTAGATVKGSTSGAEGRIQRDADGGATGTLIISPNNAIPFIDNEEITDSESGAAVVNGGLNTLSAAPSDYSWFQETNSSISATISTENLLVRQFSGDGLYRIAIPLKDKYVKISAKGTGTVTNSLMRIIAALGTV